MSEDTTNTTYTNILDKVPDFGSMFEGKGELLMSAGSYSIPVVNSLLNAVTTAIVYSKFIIPLLLLAYYGFKAYEYVMT
jgi:hypothetical protein